VTAAAGLRLVEAPEAAPAAPSPLARRLRTGLYGGHLLTAWALGISNGLLGLCLVAAPWLGPARLPQARAARRAMAAAGAYLLLLLGAVAASHSPLESLGGLSEFVSFATFGLALLWIRGERRVRWLIDALILVGAVVALSGLAQVLLGYGGIERRIRGPFSHYMTFAGILLLLDLVLIARLLLRRERASGNGPTAWLDRPWVAWSALGIVNLALIVSLTRSAWLALVAALVGIVALVRPRLLVWAPVLAALFLIVAPVPVVERVLSVTHVAEDSNYDRIAMVEAGARMVDERPLLGVGPEMVKRLYPIYRHPTAPRLLTPHLHNAYVQLAAERGLPALAAFLGLGAFAFAAAWRGYRRGRFERNGRADLHLGALAALLGFAIAALFENNWGDTEVQRLVLFLLALPFCLEAPETAAADAAGAAGAHSAA
jgi:O-antigen ligase